MMLDNLLTVVAWYVTTSTRLLQMRPPACMYIYYLSVIRSKPSHSSAGCFLYPATATVPVRPVVSADTRLVIGAQVS